MVADTNENKPIETLQSNHRDTTLPSEQVVRVEADEATKIVAANITAITSISKNLSSLLTQLRTFNDKYNVLLTNKDYDNNTKTGVEVLESSLDLKNYLTQISDIAKNLTNILKVADLENQITQLSLIENDIKQVVNNLENILKTASLEDYIVNVSAISDDIVRIKEIENIIISLVHHIEQLNTLYNYLPQLLKLAQFVEQYLELQQTLGFSDEEYFNILNSISTNLAEILKVADKIDTMVSIANRLDEFPDILEKIDEDLKNLYIKYQLELENKAKELTDNLHKSIIDTRTKFQEMIEKQANYVEECRKISLDLRQMQSDIKIAELNLDKLQIEIQANAKNTIQNMENKFSRLELDYTNKFEKLINENKNLMDEKSNEFFVTLSQLEAKYKLEIESIEKKVMFSLERLDKSINEYEEFKSQIKLIIQAEIGKMLKVDLNPFLNQNRFSRDEIINLISLYAPAVKTLTETEIKELVKDTIVAQGLSREEVITWLEKLNEYRDSKLYIENFDSLFQNRR